MKKSIKIWLFLALCLTICISFAILASAEAPVCVGSHTYDNECDKECNVCASIRFAPHKNEDGNDVCDLCESALCEHITRPDFIDFSGCENPRTCRLCGETDSPQGHYWAAATCTAPRVCSTCRKFDGEPLGHKWGDASCTTVATCTVCKMSAEHPAGHKYDGACDKDCNVCMTPRDVSHVDLNGDSICDLCNIAISDGGLNGGEIAVIIILPLLSIAAGIGVYVLLTKLKNKKAQTPEAKQAATQAATTKTEADTKPVKEASESDKAEEKSESKEASENSKAEEKQEE